jgi:hypothetical protein
MDGTPTGVPSSFELNAYHAACHSSKYIEIRGQVLQADVASLHLGEGHPRLIADHRAGKEKQADTRCLADGSGSTYFKPVMRFTLIAHCA